MGLVPERAETGSELDDPELRFMTRRLWVSVVLGVSVLLLAMLPMLKVPVDQWIGGTALIWIQFTLATPVVLWGGWPFFERGWRSILTGKLNMFTLIALGTGAAYFYSVAVVLFPSMIPAALQRYGQPEVYFEAAAVITALVLLGQILEHRAVRRTGGAIRALLSLAPPTAASSLMDMNTWCLWPTCKRAIRSASYPATRFPFDGEVVEGSSSVDESMITGKPIPVEKTIGDEVIGGTINQTGSFLLRAKRVGNETVLAQIVQMVGDANKPAPPYSKWRTSWLVTSSRRSCLRPSSRSLPGPGCRQNSRHSHTPSSMRWRCLSSPALAPLALRPLCQSWSASGEPREKPS